MAVTGSMAAAIPLQFQCSVDESPIGLGRSISYCLITSGSFVGALYVLVPASVRELDREDPQQILWRTTATFIAGCGALVLYPYFVCDNLPSLYARSELRVFSLILLHISLLYLGSFVIYGAEWLEHILQHERNMSFMAFVSRSYHDLMLALRNSSHKGVNKSGQRLWITMRNLVVAPINEEFVFRYCNVSALASVSPARLSTSQIIFTAPLFFGVAHSHHAYQNIKRGLRYREVAMQAFFQVTYTTLFGSYVTYVFLRTRSLLAVIFCHSFCNAFGAPVIFSFQVSASLVYRWRWWIMASYLMGFVSFFSLLPIIFRNPHF